MEIKSSKSDAFSYGPLRSLLCPLAGRAEPTAALNFAPGLNLRVVDRDGEPRFVAKDACAALEMPTTTGANQWLRGLDDDEVCLLKKENSPSLPNRGVYGVNESGLYSLILKSRKPEAKAFKKWVTSEVLPTIRKTGGYMVPSATPKPSFSGPSSYSSVRQSAPSYSSARSFSSGRR